jgi:predicted N-acyltransferase
MKIILHSAASDIPKVHWASLDHRNDPFMSGAFLRIAEQTMQSGARQDGTGTNAAMTLGWQAQHLALYDATAPAGEQLLGLLPRYLRTHSFGDFSHDWHWANAWERVGLAYYPKLVSGVPFTPSPGPRLLVRQGIHRPPVVQALIEAAIHVAREQQVSSWQCLFVEEAERDALAASGLLIRRGVQFHWLNKNYASFDDFLASFTADKRKKLKRERRAVRESGLHLEVRHGDEIDPALWRTIHRQYRDTFLRYGNHPAFSPAFFSEAAAALGRQLLVFLAFDGERPVASAICYRDATTLYGRHWGTEVDVPGLHFELCYYQGIDYCIAHGLQRFEPGAQGEHKLARGFEPAPTWSGYWIADPGMRHAVADFIHRETHAMEDYATETASHLPFKK